MPSSRAGLSSGSSTPTSSLSTASSTDDAASLLESMSSLSLATAGGARSRGPSSSSSSTTSDLLTQAGSNASSGSTRNLIESGFLLVSASSRPSLSSGASSTGSESSSQLLADFFSESGSYCSSTSSRADRRAYKLAVWQAILVTVGLCESEEGVVMPGLKRPPHFPATPLELPTSVNACNKLIKEYIYLNIVNFKDSQLNANEPLLLFPSASQLTKYTLKHHRFVKLAKAKRELLNPLLRTFSYRSRLQTVREE